MEEWKLANFSKKYDKRDTFCFLAELLELSNFRCWPHILNTNIVCLCTRILIISSIEKQFRILLQQLSKSVGWLSKVRVMKNVKIVFIFVTLEVYSQLLKYHLLFNIFQHYDLWKSLLYADLFLILCINALHRVRTLTAVNLWIRLAASLLYSNRPPLFEYGFRFS